jgi:2-oxoglutarate dehydrogenase E1 component
MSGLVMLLPHGYEGQGPEHSSARLERYLQACDDDSREFPTDLSRQAQAINMQVVNCTTPANFFHVLRRQLHREYRKPLVVMTPKRGLQYRGVRSNIEDFGPETSFRRLIPETSTTLVPDNEIRRLVFTSGNVYHDLVAERDETRAAKDSKSDGKEREVAICRIEQYAPFPYDKVKEQIAKYPNVCRAMQDHVM